MRTFFLAALWSLLSTSTLAAGQGKLTVYTVNYPLQYFAQRIAGDHADVVFPAPSDEDPAFWQPSTETIADYQKADLILLNGATYAKWLNRVTLPRRKLVNTSVGFKDRYIYIKEGVTHSHGLGGNHSHGGTAFTTWLDFSQASEQARAVAEALTRIRPEWEKDFMRNLATLETDLLNLDKQIRAIVNLKLDQPLLASHPVYQYFQRHYGLELKSVMWEPNEVPNEALWSKLESILKQHPAQWMIWEGEPNSETVKRLHNIGVEIIVFNPTGNRAKVGDFLTVMKKNVKNLSKVFK